ncbi:ig-like domain-containing protein [Caerostris extrusa]|uniref:Ig-like domain-containing protein n=1 Tax=Caerostris extrusa TaxID=172846 RepID=A0AAV4QGX3_CAEEX|nr:ig-like domain-containing protein [Caerostris extrusa]
MNQELSFQEQVPFLVLKTSRTSRDLLFHIYLPADKYTGGQNKQNKMAEVAPVCKNRAVQVFGVAKQETLNITCELEADPIDVKFHWTLNNTVESMEVKKFVSEGTSSTVFYTPRNMLGYGALLCWGSNDIGRQKDPCVYRIVPVGECAIPYSSRCLVFYILKVCSYTITKLTFTNQYYLAQ